MVQGVVRTLMRLGVLLLALLPALWLASCASHAPQLLPALAVPEQDALRGTPAETLLASADEAASNGHDQAASLYLERAIRLAPNSSWLYKKMADLRLGEGDAHAAEGFARHALRNAATGDRQYRASLYELLATCLARQGDAAGAASARQQATDLLR